MSTTPVLDTPCIEATAGSPTAGGYRSSHVPTCPRRGGSPSRRAGWRIYQHRMAYELEWGPIPPGRVVLHLCGNPACVNTSHLQLGTRADLAALRESRGRGRWSKVARSDG